MTCIALAALIASHPPKPYVPQFAEELQRMVAIHQEVTIDHIPKEIAFRMRQIVNGIPGVVVTSVRSSETESEIVVRKIFKEDR